MRAAKAMFTIQEAADLTQRLGRLRRQYDTVNYQIRMADSAGAETGLPRRAVRRINKPVLREKRRIDVLRKAAYQTIG